MRSLPFARDTWSSCPSRIREDALIGLDVEL